MTPKTPYLPILLLHLLLLTLLTASPLSLPPSLPLTLTHPTTPQPLTRSYECFNLTTLNAYPVDLPSCPHALELLFHDPTGVMSLQRFSRHPSSSSPTFYVPVAWQVGGCQIVLTSGRDNAVDRFRLADVIVQARRIIEECPPGSKRALGGLALVGNGETFFVAVNGPDDGPDLGEEGGLNGEGMVAAT